MVAYSILDYCCRAGPLPLQPSGCGFDHVSRSFVFLDECKILQSPSHASTNLQKSIMSLIYVFAHCLLSRRFRSAGLRRPAKTRLDSACSNLPRLLMLLWIVATAMDLIVASRRPICLPQDISTGYWTSGISCRMHRAISACSLLAL